MVSESNANKIGSKVKTYEAVLILVLVEDGLREVNYCLGHLNRDVLILVLVEDGLRDGRRRL